MRVLVCALNWGLGHATRSSPIIDAMLKRGHEVHLGTDGLAAEVWNKSYPDLPLHKLAPLHIVYGKYFWIKLGIQFIPFIYWTIRDKYKLKRLNKLHQFDLIISDSRPACSLHQVYSIFITNQPSPIFPLRWIERIVRLGMRILMNSYDETWIPDLPGLNSLSGDLINLPLAIESKFIGFLSRINQDLKPDAGFKGVEIVAILSGPEPLRTQLVEQLKTHLLQENMIILGGRPDHNTDDNQRYIGYLPPDEIAAYILQSKIVISRGGYSSLMDFAPFGKKLVLVPTPGQTEQNYLADRLASRNEAIIWDIDKEPWLSIKHKAERLNPFYIQNDPSLLPLALDHLQNTLKKN
jgi:UDP:flavonoid glycosyltransferase YjiC (YdhE family)